MNKTTEALKMAIAFMETLTIDTGIKTWNEKHRKEAVNACKEALESQAQPLSDDAVNAILVKHGLDNVEMAGNHIDVVLLMRDVEQAHGIK